MLTPQSPEFAARSLLVDSIVVSALAYSFRRERTRQCRSGRQVLRKGSGDGLSLASVESRSPTLTLECEHYRQIGHLLLLGTEDIPAMASQEEASWNDLPAVYIGMSQHERLESGRAG